MHPLDPYRAALILIRQHRLRAPEMAQRRISELGTAGDTAGHAVWVEILVAITKLRLDAPPPGSVRH